MNVVQCNFISLISASQFTVHCVTAVLSYVLSPLCCICIRPPPSQRSQLPKTHGGFYCEAAAGDAVRCICQFDHDFLFHI